MSISVTPEIEVAIRKSAERAGLTVSAWLARAAEHVAKIEDGHAAVTEFEAHHGTFTVEEHHLARRQLVEDGVLAPGSTSEPN